MPQKTTLEADGLAEADVRDTTVTLPEGVQLSPSAANGLEACSEAQVGYHGLNAATQTQEFTGSPGVVSGGVEGGVGAYQDAVAHAMNWKARCIWRRRRRTAKAGRNPFDSLVALYLVAEDPVSGVLVKLAGKGELNESTLRVATTFTNTPQVPFEELEARTVRWAAGSLSHACALWALRHAGGVHAVVGHRRRWIVLSPAEEFEITSGAYGGRCPARLAWRSARGSSRRARTPGRGVHGLRARTRRVPTAIRR